MGATTVYFTSGSARMNSQIYVVSYSTVIRVQTSNIQEVLEKHLVPAMAVYGGDAELIHDNAPYHTSNITKAAIAKMGINVSDSSTFLLCSSVPPSQVFPWPAESPDTNPIETIFGDLKQWLRHIARPRNLQQIQDAVQSWVDEHLSVEKCRAHIRNIHRCIDLVIAREGGPIRGKGDNQPDSA